MANNFSLGLALRFALAIGLATPLSVGLLWLLASLMEGSSATVDGEAIAYLIAFLALAFPGLVIATIVGWFSQLWLADFGSVKSTISGLLIAGGIAAVCFIAALWFVGFGMDYSPALLLLPVSQGAIATSILLGLTRRHGKGPIING